MNNLTHKEYYEILEARHRKSRVTGLVLLVVFAVIGLSGLLLESTIVFENTEVSYLVFIFSLGFIIYTLRTWNGSNELKLLRELFSRNEQ